MVRFVDPEDAPSPSETDGSDGVRFICPYCEDYAGKPDSIRAHIRGKTDELHKGKSGFEDGSEPVQADGSPAPVEREPEMEPEPEPKPEPEEDESGIGTWLVIGGLTFLYWLARRTGNENTVQNRMSNRPR